MWNKRTVTFFYVLLSLGMSPPPEVPNSLPEGFQGHPKVPPHGLTKLELSLLQLHLSQTIWLSFTFVDFTFMEAELRGYPGQGNRTLNDWFIYTLLNIKLSHLSSAQNNCGNGWDWSNFQQVQVGSVKSVCRRGLIFLRNSGCSLYSTPIQWHPMDSAVWKLLTDISHQPQYITGRKHRSTLLLQVTILNLCYSII